MSAFQTQEKLANWFEIISEVIQGCVLSLILFLVYMTRMTIETNSSPDAVKKLLFVNNQTFAHEWEGKLQGHTNNFYTVCEQCGMKISISKSWT